MSDWLNKISTIISQTDERIPELLIPEKEVNTPAMLDELDNQPKSFFSRPKQKSSAICAPSESKTQPVIKHHAKESPMDPNIDPNDDDDNLKALKRLRELPRGSQVESRIAAIENLLGEREIFKTLKMLRWPQGVICPNCRSTNVIRKDPPANATDQRHYYVCLTCKENGEEGSGSFDDFTGLPIKSMYALRQWVLCWYLIGFCSVMQIAKLLGISPQEVIQIASLGNDLTLLPDAELSASKSAQHRKEKQTEHRFGIEEQEERTRSESRAPLKPGYKSKK